MVQQVPSPCVLVEMGSGNSEKSRIFIDAILEQQPTLQYMPVDISKGCNRKKFKYSDRYVRSKQVQTQIRLLPKDAV